MSENISSEFPNTFYVNDILCTRNLCPGNQVYGETLYKIKGEEYRSWDPNRSKLAALILKGCKFLPITPTTDVLYLGAANGTTASHVSDIATLGKIFCVEFSARAFKDLLKVADARNNMYPILEDAFYPGRYGPLVGKVDVLYQDISQRDQLRIFIINARNFLKPHSHGILMIKSRSIDITKAPKQIFKEIITQLNDQGFKILEQHTLEPYTKDHLGIIIKSMV